MKIKEKTIRRKNERKLKEYMKESVLDIDALRLEICTEYPQKYPDGVVDFDRNVQQSEINIQCQYEITQYFNQEYKQ